MTLPDKLTFSRLLSTPLVFFTWYLAFYLGYLPKIGTIVLWFLFVISEITDILDGYIARKQGLVSNLGKLLDPFSDVFLRITYFVCFVVSDVMPVWTLAIILWRELGIIFIRMILIQNGTVLAANSFGKIKSLLYFFSAFGGLFLLSLRIWQPALKWLPLAAQCVRFMFIVAALASLLSFIIYLKCILRASHENKIK